MDYRRYEIQKGDTLESIALAQNVNVKELLDFHNANSTLTQQFFGSTIPIHIDELIVPLFLEKKEKGISDSVNFEQKARYRYEQTVVMKLNGIIHSHADTKREFVVEKRKTKNNQIVKIKLTENIIDAYQKQLELALKLVCEIDMIKSDVLVNLNQNGKISNILNHNEIIQKWHHKKNQYENDFTFMRDSNSKQDFKNFLNITDLQIVSEENLINDLYSKLFFDVFFDKYLVNDNFLDDYSRTFYSQLFDGYAVKLNFTQNILSESPSDVAIRKVSSFSKSDLDNEFLEKQYDNKFKPIVKYRFSEYNFSVRERCIINTDENWIESSDITIIEEVKNNVQVLIDYKLRKIE